MSNVKKKKKVFKVNLSHFNTKKQLFKYPNDDIPKCPQTKICQI